jgi:O-antigen/teichoic acid export membrane protein
MFKMTPEKLVILSAWGSRLITGFIMIYSLRILSVGLTASEYAILVIIIGLSGWYTLVGDPGIGYAVQNSITRKIVLKQNPNNDVLTAYALLALVATLVALLSFGFNDQISNFLFSGFSEEKEGLNASTLWWSGLILTAGASAGVSSKVLYAVHKGYIVNIITAIASIFGFLLLTTGLEKVEHKVIYAIFSLYGPNSICAMVLAIWQIKKAWKLRPSINRLTIISLLKTARWFLFFNLIAAAVLQIDYIVMSQKIEPLEIILYYNIAKLFAFSASFNQAIMFAIWPRFTEQFETGQSIEISRSINKVVIIGVVLALITTASVMLASEMLSGLLSPGTPLDFRYTVIAGFGAIALIRSITDPYAIFLQSIGRIKALIIFATIQAFVGGALQWILSDYLGIEGILIALVLSFLLTATWGLPRATRSILSQAR